MIVLALRRAGHDSAGAVERALDWMLGMQSRSGGCGAFDVDNESRLAAKLAFCDFGAVTDPPSADVTAHVLETLADVGLAGEPAARRALDWLLRQQERDGSWFGRWGANYLYGTGAVLPALAACGLDGHESVTAAVELARGASRIPAAASARTCAPTATAAGAAAASRPPPRPPGRSSALHAAGAGESEAATRAVSWLAETQRPDGGWDEPYYTGTGFPGDFYLNYHLYRDVFPVMALGRVLGQAR